MLKRSRHLKSWQQKLIVLFPEKARLGGIHESCAEFFVGEHI